MSSARRAAVEAARIAKIKHYKHLVEQRLIQKHRYSKAFYPIEEEDPIDTDEEEEELDEDDEYEFSTSVNRNDEDDFNYYPSDNFLLSQAYGFDFNSKKQGERSRFQNPGDELFESGTYDPEEAVFSAFNGLPKLPVIPFEKQRHIKRNTKKFQRSEGQHFRNWIKWIRECQEIVAPGVFTSHNYEDETADLDVNFINADTSKDYIIDFLPEKHWNMTEQEMDTFCSETIYDMIKFANEKHKGLHGDTKFLENTENDKENNENNENNENTDDQEKQLQKE